MRTKTRVFWAVAALGAALGLIYSTFSTLDFGAHLDRQLHPVSCSLLPGLTEASQVDLEAQGCKAAMFSPYSSVLREQYWGGIPVSLFGMGLFGFTLALALWGVLTGRGHRPAPSQFLLFSGSIAVATSLVFFTLSATQLHTVCKLCVGTYIGSGILLLGAVLAFLAGRSDREAEAADVEEEPHRSSSWQYLLLLAEMGFAVFLPALLYVATLPDYSEHVRSCETLTVREDKAGVLLVPKPPVEGATEALLVEDPLCPTCKAFHDQLQSSPRTAGLNYKVLLMPLDAECNWNVMGDSLHPGSCMLSRALLCAKDEAGSMLTYIYGAQEHFNELGKAGKLDEMKQELLGRFPAVKQCLDAPETKIKLNRALHLAVRNKLPVQTPQLYLDGKRLCDEDTDLGLDYALVHLLEQGQPEGAGK